MARFSKKQKRAVLLRRKRLLRRCFFHFENASFLMKTLLLKRIHNLGVACEEYNRNPRRAGRKRSTDWCYNDMLQMEDAEFIANFRLSRPSFAKLCNQLRPLIVKEETFAKNTVSVERRVAMTLYFLGQGINYRAVANQFGVAVPTVCRIVHETTKAIVHSLTPEYIKFPESDAEYLAAMATFLGKQIPNCVGAIDGSHIRILRPTECSTDFYNRKAYYSILLQGICDGNGKFLSVSCGYPGSIHDARMLRRSGFYKNVLNKRYLNKMHHDLPLVILGDSAYPRFPWLLVPYAGTSLSPDQLQFNLAHSSTRIIIENAFGQLKGRFRLISKQVDIATCKVDQIVIACCTLYNFCLNEKEAFPDEWLIDDEVVEEPADANVDLELDANEEEWELGGNSTQDIFLQVMFNNS